MQAGADELFQTSPIPATFGNRSDVVTQYFHIQDIFLNYLHKKKSGAFGSGDREGRATGPPVRFSVSFVLGSKFP